MRPASPSTLIRREGKDLDFEADIPDADGEDSHFEGHGTKAEDLETAGMGGFESDESEDLGSDFDGLRSDTTDGKSSLGNSKSDDWDFTTGELGSDKGTIKSDSEDLDSGRGGLDFDDDDFLFAGDGRTFSADVMAELLLMSSLNFR